MDSLERYWGASVFEDLNAIRNCYCPIEGAIHAFESHFSIHCPAKCARCCQRFIADVTRLEGLLLTHELIDVQRRGISFLKGWSQSNEGCPLLDGQSHKCTACRARPLVCSLLGSAASQTRSGLVFGACSLPPKGERISRIGEAELRAAGVVIPVMGHYGKAVDDLQASPVRKLVDEAILEGASRLELIALLLAG